MSQTDQFERFVQDTFSVCREKAIKVRGTVEDLVARSPELRRIEIKASTTMADAETIIKEIGTSLTPAIYVPVAAGLATMLALPIFGVTSPILVAVITLLVFVLLAYKYSMPRISEWIEKVLATIKPVLN